VVTNRHSPERQFPVFFRHLNEAEIGGATTHIDDQDGFANMHGLSPALLLRLDPGVEGGLGFFEEGYMFETGRMGGFDGQFAGHCIEGRWHGQIDVLGFAAGLGTVPCHLVVPGVTQVLQKRGRGFHRRNAASVRRTVPGEDAVHPVHPAVAQPGFGG